MTELWQKMHFWRQNGGHLGFFTFLAGAPWISQFFGVFFPKWCQYAKSHQTRWGPACPETLTLYSPLLLIWSLFSHAWLGSQYNTYRCLIAHLCGLLVMHGGNSFNIRGQVVSIKVMMLKELPPCITSCHHASLVAHTGVQSGIYKYCIGSPIMHGWIEII